jgi:spore maturation protein SpmA
MSFSLLPTTVLTLRRAAGTASPYIILPAVWICSAASAILAVLLCRLAAPLSRGRR